ncbi:serine hydrolase domain-containing protein [Lysobacter sp. cf310]|uniref:serine hydrolase domain-containing protein n=1 Tax=Lysobacter sp. cf310 TaxID=1761790 RepID=UPI0008E9BB56|nr:serine hydrolase domain-containing protein [Lysobacter sp. cf310]SFK53312.1 CubicO group peptidase, beta-lactamase class C family [Lysobacter sp. cf310]
MKRRRWWPLAALGCLLLQTGAATAFDGIAPATSTQAGVLREDAWNRTVSGVRYITPAGWTAQAQGPAIVMRTPTEDARIALVDVVAHTAEEAVASAWRHYRPAGAPRLRDARDRPLRAGWSSIRSYDYESAQDPNRVVRAQVLHEGETWIVAIMDLPSESMSRREAQVTRVLSSLRAKTYVPDTLAGKRAHELDADRIATLLRFLEDARSRLGIPGLALGVVQNDEVKYAGGLGVRKVGSADKVDASTRFLIASVTKPLTSLMLAKLVDMGKLDWDAPAARLLPSFKVGDPALTQRIRVRNLLCACTGIPAQDMEWVLSGDELDPDDVLGLLATVKPTAEIGELYQYSNLMAVSAGYLGAHVAHPELPLGEGYDRTMQELVFDPLGMRATTFDFALAQRGNFASPHGTTIDGEVAVAAMGYNLMSIPMRPDGGAWSNIDDLTRYLRMELASGRLPQGGRYIGEQALHERLKGQVARGGVDQWYGMGLKTDRRAGILQVVHGGSMAGYQAEIFWLPENDVGYVLLMNADAGAQVRGFFADRFIELLFDVDRGAAATLDALPARLRREREEHRVELAPLDAPTLRRLAPMYSHPTLGSIRIVMEGTSTWFDFGGWRTEVLMTRDEADTVIESISPSVAGFRFTVTQRDGVRALVLDDEQRTYRFLEGDGTASRSGGSAQ